MGSPFGVTAKIDADTLEQIVQLRQKDGLHVDYQYGVLVGHFDWDFAFPKPIYDGCSIRIFIYNQIASFSKLRMSLKYKEPKYYGMVQVTGTNVVTRYGIDGDERDGPYDQGDIEEIGIYSIGLRVKGKSIVPLVNKWVGDGFDMRRKVSEEDWSMKIWTGENYIVSLHVCDEVGESFPKKGLNQSYTLDNLVLPIGSYVTITAVFVGSDKKVLVRFKQLGGSYVDTNFQNVPLREREEFRIKVRNSSQGWLVTTSFVGATENARLVTRMNEEQFTNAVLGDTCYIKKIIAVCPIIPVQFRPK